MAIFAPTIAAVAVAAILLGAPARMVEAARTVGYGFAGAQVTVKSAEQLAAAISSAREARTILLEPGRYAFFSVRGANPTGEVTIASRDPARPAVLEGFDIRNSSGLTFRNLELQASPKIERDAFLVQGVRKFRLTKLLVRGENGRPGYDDRLVFVRDSQDVEISQSEFRHADMAIQLLDTEGVSVKANYFHDLQMDAIRGGGNSRIVIADNYITDFAPTRGHPDAIQFWSANQTKSAEDITITGNVILRGKGNPVQGIFMGNEKRHLPYRGVRIADNIVVGGMFNGIACLNGADLLIENNVVIPAADMKSWIRVFGDATLNDNHATIYLINDKRLKQIENNTILQPGHSGRAALKRWASQRSLAGYDSNLQRYVASL